MSAVDDHREFERHLTGHQQVYEVSGHRNQPEELCAEHAHQVLGQHHEKTMLGLSTGLIGPSEETPEPKASSPHIGQCRACARQLAVGNRQLQPPGLDDHAPGRASPYTTKAPSSFSRPRQHEVAPFHALPPSLNAKHLREQPDTADPGWHERNGQRYRLVDHGTDRVSAGIKHPGDDSYGQVGYLSHFDDGEIKSTWVHPAHRRNGVATAMLTYARERHPDIDIHHSTNQTEDAKAWSAHSADYHGVPGGEVHDCACGLPVEYDPIDGWQHADGSVSHDGEFYGKSVSELMKGVPPPKTAARFTPGKRIFTHTCGLDHRLFDEHETLRPDVRGYIVSMLTAFWMLRYRNWQKWAKVYFAGSEASEWTSETLEGNNDFDVLIGIDYDAFRTEHGPISSRATLTDQQITDRMNDEFRAGLNPLTKDTMIDIDGVPTGPWDNTWYVNPDSYDIRKIKPYAAYDVTGNTWVVKPPHLPHWSLADFPKPVVRTLRAADDYARAVLKLPEPQRTQQGAALFEAWHSDRSRAFSERGEGWYDVANLREKWLDQHGLWAELVDCAHRAKEGLDLAPADWSNTPPGYVASLPKTQTCKYCSQQATKRVIHSEGMAYIPVCDKHLAKGKSDAADCTPDGSYDPSNVNAIRPIAAATQWITPQLLLGPMPHGLNHARQVGSPEEALAAIREGFTAVLPRGTEMGLWRILSELGMSRLEITQHLNLLASTPGA